MTIGERITDAELARARYANISFAGPIGLYAAYLSLLVGRLVTLEAAQDVLERLNRDSQGSRSSVDS